MFTLGEWDKHGEVSRCPNVWFGADVSQALGWWGDWVGFRALPCPGELRDQPAPVYEALTLCQGESTRVQRERAPQEPQPKRSR